MGEVFRATDTKLGREVALKILPQAFASESDRMARFQREAQVLASLNHPNIAAVYGIEDGALVMELVEGQTLAERVAHGLIPIDEALPIALQIAEAVETAHEKGIIHRDLKPGNVKITPEGTVKVLDFGLAKAAEDTTGSGDPSNSPTLTAPATQAGMIMGTAAYMAPEQARGQAADRRADIWSFGAVLFEMLAGQRAFAGETTPDVLASVLKSGPDWNALPGSTPASIMRLLHRCLTKDRK
jgi:eukaryotic-like serine/threonine-protein kinase